MIRTLQLAGVWLVCICPLAMPAFGQKDMVSTDLSPSAKKCLEMVPHLRSLVENANTDSAKAMATIDLLGALRFINAAAPELYNSNIDRAYCTDALNLARKSGCVSCQGYAHLMLAYGVPPEWPFPFRFSHFDSALVAFSSMKDSHGLLITDVYRAEILYHIDKKKEALLILDQVKSFRSDDFNPIFAYYHNQNALWVQWSQSRYSEAGEEWRKAISFVENHQGNELDRGFIRISPGRFVSYHAFMGELWGNIGLTQRRTTKLSSALSSFQKAINFYEVGESLEGQIWMFQMISQIHFDQGNYHEAVESSNSSLELVERHIESGNRGTVIAYVESLKFGLEFYLKVGMSDLLMKKANTGLRLCRTFQSVDSSISQQIGFLYTWKAICHHYQSNEDSASIFALKALQFYQKVPEYFLEIGHRREDVAGHKAMCHVLLASTPGNNEEETRLKNRVAALTLIGELTDDWPTRNILRLADLFSDFGEYDQALRLYDIASKRAEKSEFILLKKTIAQRRSKTYREMGDMASAYEELSTYINYSDSIKNFSHIAALAEADARYRNELTSRENAELQLHNGELRKKASRRNGIILIVAFLLISFVFSFFWYYKIKNKNAALLEAQLDNERLERERAHVEQLKQQEELKRIQAEKALTRKERERLEASKLLADERAERYQFELQQKEKELSGRAIQQLKNQKELESLRQRIKNNLGEKGNGEMIEKYFKQFESNGDWEEFQMRMENVHPTFNKRLAELHGNLTANEKRLCSLVRLNLTIKQIATLQNNSPESVNKARYRLRKKLQLERGQDLFAYLESLTVEP